jgi:hypothetical protein
VNLKTSTLIREACAFVRENGYQIIRGGAWFEWDSEKILACDPIGAVLIYKGAVPKELDPKRPETLVNPGLMEAARDVLDVDHFWLYRFWMGFDRGFQIKVTNEKSDTETKDEISESGIALARELFQKK